MIPSSVLHIFLGLVTIEYSLPLHNTKQQKVLLAYVCARLAAKRCTRVAIRESRDIFK